MGAPAIKDEESALLVSLVVRAQQGDVAVFSQIIEKTQNRLFRFCLYLSGNPQLAEEICQEAFVKFFQQIKSLKSPVTYLSWLFQIAKNQFLDEKRKPMNKQELVQASPDFSEYLERQDSGGQKGGQNSQTPDVTLDIRRALLRLEPEERVVLVLVDMEEHSYLEAAEMIGISENALRSRVHRARKAFLTLFNRT